MELEEEWNFCPNCSFSIKGAAKKEEMMNRVFNRIFREVFATDRSMQRESEKEEKDVGFSISVSSDENEPRIKVRTIESFSDMKGDKIRIPKKTKEAQADITRIGDRLNVIIKLPHIKKEEDISLNRYPQSIEVRAFTRNVLYYKIIQIPPSWHTIRKEFNKGILKIEVSP